MSLGLIIFAATYFLIAVQRLPFVHLNRPAAGLLVALATLRVRPTPYLLALAMGANVGSVLSVTGNPQNMLVGIWSGTTFGAFLVHMLPVAAGGLAITYGVLRRAFRGELAQGFPERFDAAPVVIDRPLVFKGLATFAVAVVAWLAGGSPLGHWAMRFREPATIRAGDNPARVGRCDYDGA